MAITAGKKGSKVSFAEEINNTIIKPNTTAWVIDTITKTNAIFFIKKVTYTKNLSSGSITKVTMVPSKKANDDMYAAQGSLNGGITGKAAWTFNELWANKKG